MTKAPTARPRILVVEDENLIRMLLEDMLADLDYDLVASVGSLDEATDLATNGAFDAAILNVNIEGQESFPIAEILAKRGLPYIFVTGYGKDRLPPDYRGRPTLQKPFQSEHLKAALTELLAHA